MGRLSLPPVHNVFLVGVQCATQGLRMKVLTSMGSSSQCVVAEDREDSGEELTDGGSGVAGGVVNNDETVDRPRETLLAAGAGREGATLPRATCFLWEIEDGPGPATVPATGALVSSIHVSGRGVVDREDEADDVGEASTVGGVDERGGGVATAEAAGVP